CTSTGTMTGSEARAIVVVIAPSPQTDNGIEAPPRQLAAELDERRRRKLHDPPALGGPAFHAAVAEPSGHAPARDDRYHRRPARALVLHVQRRPQRQVRQGG